MSEQYRKTGYLNSDFRIFYLTNTEARDFQSHYHDFHKLLVFQSGSVSYYIEGQTYQLMPWDIVMVPAGQVHRPVIHDSAPYHRLILYLSPAFFERYRERDVDLERCFTLCARRGSRVLRPNRFPESRIYPVFCELARTVQKETVSGLTPLPAAAEELYQKSVLLQFLLLLGCLLDENGVSCPAPSSSNDQILKVLSYINGHLREDLSVDRIAESCYLNRSYLMHLFRRETGYTLGGYITEKRLFAARSLIQSGVPVTEAWMQSGFSSYAAFYRAYRKKFGEAPSVNTGAEKIHP